MTCGQKQLQLNVRTLDDTCHCAPPGPDLYEVRTRLAEALGVPAFTDVKLLRGEREFAGDAEVEVKP